jgi:hypothetical protein
MKIRIAMPIKGMIMRKSYHHTQPIQDDQKKKKCRDQVKSGYCCFENFIHGEISCRCETET